MLKQNPISSARYLFQESTGDFFKDRGRGGHSPALPIHDMQWLRTLGNETWGYERDK